MSIRSVVESVEAAIAAHRDAAPPAPVSGPRVGYVASHGQSPKPLTWVALITGTVAKYYGKGGCPEWDSINWWYQWEGVWSNENSAVPYPQPVYFLDNVEGTLQEDNWPNKYTLDFQAGKLGFWAINTAEFDYAEGSKIGRGRGGTGAPGQGLQTLANFYVTMALGLFDDHGACAAEPRTPRVVPFFHQYIFPDHEVCF